MEKEEKVIKGLEICIKNINQVDCPNDCPYYSDCTNYEKRYIFQPLLRDALKLIKEQEPRVLTWDEVKRAEVCWTEERGSEPYAELDADEWNPKYYGKTIRCWNYKPTKEQMAAVNWDDDITD